LQGILAGEEGAIVKDPGGKVSVALVYPNRYSVGMGNLAVHSLYRIINERSDMLCERFFLPDPSDMKEHLRSKTGLLSLESQRPLSEFDCIAFSVSFENDLMNIIPILSLGRLEHRREARASNAPVLVAGGAAATINQSPFSPIFDSTIPGEFEAFADELPEIILKKDFSPRRRHLENLDSFDCESVIEAPKAQFGEMHLMELQRGCPRGCKFCATPSIYSPFRERSVEKIISMIERAKTRKKRFGLIGSDVLSHRNFSDIAAKIHEIGGKFSPSSIRADAITPEIAAILARSSHKSSAIGVEAARESLRNTLGKGLSDAMIFSAAENLASAGIMGIRLYFMIGLPGEDDGDILAIPEFAKRIRDTMAKFRPKAPSAGSVEVTISPFIPKPGTKMASSKFEGIAEIKRRFKLLRSAAGRMPWLKLGFDSPESAACEAFLATAGKEAIEFLETAFETGTPKAAIKKHAPWLL